MADKEIITKWLKKADDDFDFAVSIMKNGTFFSHICFHFQQSAEKYLKAFIICNDLEFRRIHNLVELLEICKRADISFEELRWECKFLTPLYIDSRYPLGV
ncbi:MAG: HEPN domain-containing protein, partial [Elusimicrobiota bacterium]|nr:HEPN domain-containing protein [Elusimicrobiota bacterium]